jgi:hypothetical protein
MTACPKSACWQTLPLVYGKAALKAATYEVFAAEPHPKNVWSPLVSEANR